MSRSAFGVEHGEFSKALPKVPNLASFANTGKAFTGAAKSTFGQFKAGFKTPNIGGGTFKPYKPFSAGQQARKGANFLNANKKPIAGGFAAGGVAGAGINSATSQNKRLSQYR